MIITISGDIGSGKSTTGKLLAKQLGYRYLSTGSIQRELAAKRNLTTLELNILSEKDPSIDREIDGYTMALNNAEENYVVDSRLAWHFIPKSYKVYLRCQEEIAAKRIFNDRDRVSDESEENAKDLLTKIKHRRKSEVRRFKKKYEVDLEDFTNYDLILDSSFFSPTEIVELIIGGSKLYHV